MVNRGVTSGGRIAKYLKQSGKPLYLIRRSKNVIDALEELFDREFQTTATHRGWQTQFVDWVLFSKINTDGSYEADFANAGKMMFAMCYIAENTPSLENPRIFDMMYKNKLTIVLRMLSNNRPDAWIQDKLKFFDPNQNIRFNYWNGTSRAGQTFSAFNHTEGRSRIIPQGMPRVPTNTAPVLPAPPRQVVDHGIFNGLNYKERRVETYWIPKINELGFLIRYLKSYYKDELGELSKKLARAGVHKKVLKVLHLENDDEDYGDEEFYATLDVDDDDEFDLAPPSPVQQPPTDLVVAPPQNAWLWAENPDSSRVTFRDAQPSRESFPFFDAGLDEFAPPRGEPIDAAELAALLEAPPAEDALVVANEVADQTRRDREDEPIADRTRRRRPNPPEAHVTGHVHPRGFTTNIEMLDTEERGRNSNLLSHIRDEAKRRYIAP